MTEARYHYIHNISTDNTVMIQWTVIHCVTQIALVVYSVPQFKRRRTAEKRLDLRIPKYWSKPIKPKAQLPIKIPRSCLSIPQTAAILFSKALSRIVY